MELEGKYHNINMWFLQTKISLWHERAMEMMEMIGKAFSYAWKGEANKLKFHLMSIS